MESEETGFVLGEVIRYGVGKGVVQGSKTNSRALSGIDLCLSTYTV